jgi:hypothetical protein
MKLVQHAQHVMNANHVPAFFSKWCDSAAADGVMLPAEARVAPLEVLRARTSTTP